MPRIETWLNLPAGVREHLIDRMRHRAISIPNLYHLRLWPDSNPAVLGSVPGQIWQNSVIGYP